MSYLQGLIDDHQLAIISFWFRVPQAVIDGMNAIVSSDAGDSGPLAGLIPLVSWGPQATANSMNQSSTTTPGTASPVYTRFGVPICGWVQTDTFFPGGGGTTTYFADPSFPFTYGPSVIALNCIQGSGDPTFIFRLYTGEKGTIVASFPVSNTTTIYARYGDPTNFDGCAAPPTEFYWDPFGNGPFTRNAMPLGGANDSTTTYDDQGSLAYPSNQAWTNYNPQLPITRNLKTITADQWHHVLLSYDTSGSVQVAGTFFDITDTYVDTADPAVTNRAETDTPPTATSSSLASLAIDDVYLSGDQMRDPVVGQLPLAANIGDNAIVTMDAYTIANSSQEHSTFIAANTVEGASQRIESVVTGPDTLDFSGGTIKGDPFAVPVTSEIVARGCTIEMALLQVWTGVSCDASDLDTRRLFISDKGTPVSKARTVFGDPDVRFSGVSEWQLGNNAGSGGAFTPHHPIDGFSPKPSLFGPQLPEVVTPDPN